MVKMGNLGPRNNPRKEGDFENVGSVNMQDGFREPQKLVKLGVRIDEDLHYQASILVKKNRTSFQEVLEKALIEYVRNGSV